MKRTDIERKEREIRRKQKKEELLERKVEQRAGSIGDYINKLGEVFFHDETRIYNSKSDERILEVIEEMKENYDREECEKIIRRAIRATKVKEKEQAFKDLVDFL
jgi:hypothetical protein